jgi:hypothetical protein
MNNKTWPLLLSAFVLPVLVGCGDTEHKAHSPDHAVNESVLDAGNWGLPAVQLKRGNPWKANAATTEGISSMAALLEAFDPKQDNPDTLKSGLEREFHLIFERCTMTGEAHDQLHNYLIPMHQHMADIDLSIVEDRKAFQDYLKLYPNYFE